MKRKYKSFTILLVGVVLFYPVFMFAQTLSSPNYQVENSEFSAGGESSSSTNYKSIETSGNTDSSSSSANYNGFLGFIFNSYPGRPAAPTITNTGGNLYNSLDFVVNQGNNLSDVNYAIAVSPDAFATTTYYVQADDTLGANAVWQSYTAWGGSSGQRMTGLASSTTYTIKAQARYGTNTETGFSSTASAATSSPQITFSIAGVSISTTIAGQTTTIGTSANAMSFSTLPVGSDVIAAQTLTVTTNATGGYTTTLFQDGNLRNTQNSIQAISASNASPSTWSSGCGSQAGCFGYHTTDAALCTGTSTRFSINDTYAAATTTPTEVACNTVAVTSEQTSIVYKLKINSLQQAGTYSNLITYISTAVY